MKFLTAFLLYGCSLCCSASVIMRGGLEISAVDKAPLEAARNGLIGIYNEDQQLINQWIVEPEQATPLLSKKEISDEKKLNTTQEISNAPFKRVTGFLFNGNVIVVKKGTKIAVGTKVNYQTVLRNTWLSIPLLMTESGWKLDVRHWNAMHEMPLAKMDRAGPLFRAKQMMCGQLLGRKQWVEPIITPETDLNKVFAPHSLPAGDVDQYYGLCEDMPVFFPRPNEIVKMPQGTVLQSTDDEKQKVVIGYYAGIELVTLAKNINGEWKVVGDDYMGYLLNAEK